MSGDYEERKARRDGEFRRTVLLCAGDHDQSGEEIDPDFVARTRRLMFVSIS